ncbi:hypothetical protein F4677DRAFT_465255 [Hypoxylon crocopeplum]|nr:hypothetical protein F4677DRAFT_465255 [Hypoxylon crocopeplum]
MRSNTVIIATFATMLNARNIPRQPDISPNDNLTHIHSTRQDTGVSYNCDGSSMCPTIHVHDCDSAMNSKIIRDDNMNYGAAGSGMPHIGVCRGIATDYGCAIFVQGPTSCVRSGNDIWWDYQDIRDNGCHHCGHKYWGDGCMTTIDYEPECHRVG